MNPSRHIPRGRRLGAVTLLLAMALTFSVRAQQVHSEYEVKAAYLYRFASYVEWPEESAADQSFVIGVVGDPSIARELRKLQPGHTIGKQVVVVREVARVQELGAVRLLYVGRGRDDFLRAMGPGVTSHILIVTDEEQGLDLGGIVNFVTIDNRIRFEVSLTAAERAQLRVSADLLSVAIRVHGGRRQSDEFCVPFSLPITGEAQCGVWQARRLRPAPRRDNLRAFTRLARSAQVHAVE